MNRLMLAHGSYSGEEVAVHEPRVVHVDRGNRILDVDSSVDVLLTA